jgi:hypothetical protein
VVVRPFLVPLPESAHQEVEDESGAGQRSGPTPAVAEEQPELVAEFLAKIRGVCQEQKPEEATHAGLGRGVGGGSTRLARARLTSQSCRTASARNARRPAGVSR